MRVGPRAPSVAAARGCRWGPVHQLLRWTARLVLVLVLAVLVWQQWQQYRSQPVSSTSERRRAPFPRLTLCPGMHLKDLDVLYQSRLQLENGSLSLTEYYNRTTLEVLRLELTVGGLAVDAPAAWRQRFYLALTDVFRYRFLLRPMRCQTFEPAEARGELGDLWRRELGDVLTVELTLVASPHFVNPLSGREVAYRVFVHGDEEPNVGDLKAQKYRQVPVTPVVELVPGRRVKYRVSAKVNRLVDVRRRPCEARAGYSLAQCLKECYWEVQAARLTCRLPHMVDHGVYLPQLRGPQDHFPMCTRLVHIHRPNAAPLRCREVFRDPSSLAGDACADQVAAHTRPLAQPTAEPDGEGGLCPLPNVSRPISELTVEGMPTCRCPPACAATTYTLKETANVRKGSRCTASVKLELEATSDWIEESLAFTTTTLLANIGGFVGLITGFSLLTLAEISEALLDAVPNRWKTRRRVNADERSGVDGFSRQPSTAKTAFHAGNDHFSHGITKFE